MHSTDTVHTEVPAGQSEQQSQANESLPFAGKAERTYVQIAEDSDIESLARHLRSILDSRMVALVSFGILLVVLLGMLNIVPIVILVAAGYILSDRFVAVRRSLTIGSVAWLCVLGIGNILAGPLIFLEISLEFFFVVLGCVIAMGTCVAFFMARSVYYVGKARGKHEADTVIASHITERLIERPDDWGRPSADYLAVEGAVNQIRKRQQMTESALRDEARRKDDLVTYLAHDLKTPLASVVGYLSLLEEAPDLPAEQRAHFTGIALEKAHRLDALIEEFFDITRFDFHDIVLTRGFVSLNLMLAQVADEFYPTLTAQHKTVELQMSEKLTALIDGDKMARVFNNVMKNAIAYSYENSSIIIRATKQDQQICIAFENQGDPIPAPKLELIFEKFYRLDAARATHRGGAGLGLAIAKEIVTAHGGSISCISTPEHTMFSICLPIDNRSESRF
ncbi:HAMP domain-containing histidine kinase [Collinsella sp. zg1085]|nr:HAMP domain-containing histidine kinase [Collinsella sp. zg1085]